MNTGTKRKIASLCAMLFWLMVLGGSVFGLTAYAEGQPPQACAARWEPERGGAATIPGTDMQIETA